MLGHGLLTYLLYLRHGGILLAPRGRNVRTRDPGGQPIAFCSVPSMASCAAHAAGHCEAARPRCLSERRRRPPFHAPAFTLRAACGLAMLIGTQARSSASPKSAPVSCKPANPQDSSIEQCSSWCKADREHAQHCTVRHKPQPCIGSTLPPLCSALRCVLCVARSALLLVTRAFCH